MFLQKQEVQENRIPEDLVRLSTGSENVLQSSNTLMSCREMALQTEEDSVRIDHTDSTGTLQQIQSASTDIFAMPNAISSQSRALNSEPIKEPMTWDRLCRASWVLLNWNCTNAGTQISSCRIIVPDTKPGAQAGITPDPPCPGHNFLELVWNLFNMLPIARLVISQRTRHQLRVASKSFCVLLVCDDLERCRFVHVLRMDASLFKNNHKTIAIVRASKCWCRSV